MNNPEIKKYIDDIVALSTSSQNQANSNMMNFLQQELGKISNKFDNYRVEDIESREEHRQEMIATVEKKIQNTVNGKIDVLRQENNTGMKEIKETTVRIEARLDELEPLKKNYFDNDTTWKTLKRWFAPILVVCGGVSIILGAWFAITQLFQ